MEILKVKILEDGLSCIELDKNNVDNKQRIFDVDISEVINNAANEWGIKSTNIIFYNAKLKANKIYQAQLLPNGKVRII